MWSPIILLTCWFCYCSINQHFSMHLLSRCSGAFRLKISALKLELDPWILGAEIITANDFFCQPKLHLGWKGMKSSSNPCTVLQLEEISLARLRRVGVMKFSFSGWTQLCLSQLLWNYWRIKRTGFAAVHWSEKVQIWSNCKGKTFLQGVKMQCVWLGLQSRRLEIIKGVANSFLRFLSRDLCSPDHVLVRLDLSRLSVIYVKFCNSFYRRMEMNNKRLLRIWPLKSTEILIGWLGPIAKQVCLTRQWD